MTNPRMRFNPPPNWPVAPAGWTPEPGWQPDPSWQPAPAGWPLWVQEQDSNWFSRHKVLTAAAGTFVVLLLCGLIGSLSENPADRDAVQVAATTASQVAVDTAAADKAAAEKEAADKAAAEKEAADKAAAEKEAADKAAAEKAAAEKAAAEPTETVSQKNAKEKAKDYLRFTAFSRSGLIKQLEFEGFSTKDATYGTDKQNADWNAQAAAKAKDYLGFTAFSRSGLIDQLEFEGFTTAQAEYGASQNGF
ncbi:Ltp family lipoprotein [Catenuloplanes sp. NPDC051500]|uniref:Ltp family lipoprotein n=1 Tax=Catenuloplanes sp. NPDC051500 TaxID=3363959 RepID=UPI0037B4E7D8